ncbi:MAG: HAD-IC family P-type ATPase, partial [Alphaproteobacteria bacterium]|nr:HAD-IC family P-type ATPase [Alphaproteobacteria bacterium]
KIVLGSDVEKMSDRQLAQTVEKCDIFAKLSPAQKARVVTALRQNGHTVGFLGDGINDALAMKAADVGVSVDTAVDIAKETADIILLEKDLTVLQEGVVDGRRIYANIIKYIKMTASSNFGNMFSVLIASVFLPFLPMLPIQILLLNLTYDISCVAIPWDNVDKDYLKKPRKWDAGSVSRFMVWLGPTSSVFDIATYALMFFFIGPMLIGGYLGLDEHGKQAFATLFQTAWFVESLWTQMLVIHMLRSSKIPVVQTMASLPVIATTSLGILIGTMMPFTHIGRSIGMTPLPLIFFPFLIGIVALYFLLVSVLKGQFIKRHGELL